MKKNYSLMLAITLLVSVLLLSVSVSARWTNTSDTAISHCYSNGNAVCSIEISGNKSSVSVTNVDVKLERKVGNSYVLVASWDDLSGGQYFCFDKTVYNVSNNYVYRLSYTAEVVGNGVTEYISDYRDVNYFNNSPV